jgi:hypothetical protein
MPGAICASKSNAAFTSDRRRPQKKTLPDWAKVSLTTFPLSTGPEMLLEMTALSLRRRCECRRRSSYSPLEGTTPFLERGASLACIMDIVNMGVRTAHTDQPGGEPDIVFRNKEHCSLKENYKLSMICIAMFHFTQGLAMPILRPVFNAADTRTTRSRGGHKHPRQGE